MPQVLSADSAVLSSDNEVEGFLTAHLKKLRDIRQLVGVFFIESPLNIKILTGFLNIVRLPAFQETIDFVSVIEQNYGGWVGCAAIYEYTFSPLIDIRAFSQGFSSGGDLQRLSPHQAFFRRQDWQKSRRGRDVF